MGLLQFGRVDEVSELSVDTRDVGDPAVLVHKLVLDHRTRSCRLAELFLELCRLLFDKVCLSLVFVFENVLLLDGMLTDLTHFKDMFKLTSLALFE